MFTLRTDVAQCTEIRKMTRKRYTNDAWWVSVTHDSDLVTQLFAENWGLYMAIYFIWYLKKETNSNNATELYL